MTCRTNKLGQTGPATDDRGDFPDLNEILESMSAEARPVTVVRLHPRRTVVVTPGGSTAECHVANDRPLAVSTVVGHVMRMEHTHAPAGEVRTTLEERAIIYRYDEVRYKPLVFGLYPEPVVGGGWGSDEDDERIFAQIAGRS